MILAIQNNLFTTGPIVMKPGDLEPVLRQQTGLALSGGVAHGDFEVGAVRYLYDIRKLRPNIITGTSVGCY